MLHKITIHCHLDLEDPHTDVQALLSLLVEEGATRTGATWVKVEPDKIDQMLAA